jgi:hypothetical protein
VAQYRSTLRTFTITNLIIYKPMNKSMLPPELAVIWQDDAQMAALFASFPSSRSINPVAYDSKLSFWKSVFLSTLAVNQVSINLSDLHLRFSRNGLTPRGIPVLLESMKGEKSLIELTCWLTWSGWALSWVAAPSSTFIIPTQLHVCMFATLRVFL